MCFNCTRRKVFFETVTLYNTLNYTSNTMVPFGYVIKNNASQKIISDKERKNIYIAIARNHVEFSIAFLLILINNLVNYSAQT